MEMNPTKQSKEALNGTRKAVESFADKAMDRAEELEGNLSSKYEAFKESAADGYSVAVDTVKKYPLYAVLGSTALGLLAGIIIARTKKVK